MRYTLTLALMFVFGNVLAQTSIQKPTSLRSAFTQSIPVPTAPNLALIPADTTDDKKQCCGGCIGGDLKYQLQFDSRQSFFSGQWARMNGLRVGMELFERYRFGLGFYNLDNEIDISELVEDPESRERLLDFKYNTTYFEYVAYQDFRWELNLPVMLGSGTGRVDTVNTGGVRGIEREDRATVFSAGVGGHLRIIPWAGLGGDLGYRWMLSDQKTVGRVFSSPFYAIRLKIWIGYLFKAMFAPKKLEAEREEYRRQRDERRNR